MASANCTVSIMPVPSERVALRLACPEHDQGTTIVRASFRHGRRPPGSDPAPPPGQPVQTQGRPHSTSVPYPQNAAAAATRSRIAESLVRQFFVQLAEPSSARGTSMWMSSESSIGPVQLGCHPLDIRIKQKSFCHELRVGQFRQEHRVARHSRREMTDPDPDGVFFLRNDIGSRGRRLSCACQNPAEASSQRLDGRAGRGAASSICYPIIAQKLGIVAWQGGILMLGRG